MDNVTPTRSTDIARNCAKIAIELNSLATNTADPQRSQKLTQLANKLWDTSLESYVHSFLERGGK